MNAVKTAILKNFAQVKDPRKHHSPPHALIEIIALTLCAVICGADDWVAVEQFGLANENWLRRFLRLPNGIPSHDTLGGVFAAIAPAEFEAAFSHWTRTISRLSRGQIEPFDVQTFSRSPDGRLGKQAIRMIRAWVDQNPLVVDYLRLDTPTETTPVSASPDPLEPLNDPVMPETQDCPTGDCVPPRNEYPGDNSWLEYWHRRFEVWPAMLARERERYDRFTPYRGQPFNNWANRVWPTPQQTDPALPSFASVEAQPRSRGNHTPQPNFDLCGLSVQAQPFTQVRQTHRQIKNKELMVLNSKVWIDNRSLRQGHSVQNLRFSVPWPSLYVPGNPPRHFTSRPTACKPVGLKSV